VSWISAGLQQHRSGTDMQGYRRSKDVEQAHRCSTVGLVYYWDTCVVQGYSGAGIIMSCKVQELNICTWVLE
jgi:hypothetical protein